MARPLRLQFPGALYHVMSRGNGKALIFLDKRDFERFLEILEATAKRFGVICSTFCLMPNHYHLVLTTPQANLSAAIKYLNGVYSQWWNCRHQRCGHTFQGRFKAQFVQRERYFLALCRYVVLNPVRAGLVQHPREWRWSNYRASARTEPAPGFLDTSAIDGVLAGCSGEEHGVAYERFITQSPDDDLDIGFLVRHDARFVGDEGFLKDERVRARQGASPAIPRKETRPPVVPLSRLCDSSRLKVEGRRSRQAQVRSAVEEFGYRVADIAGHLGLHRTSVSRILRESRGGRAASRPPRQRMDCGLDRGRPVRVLQRGS